jgi:hypothetical protein
MYNKFSTDERSCLRLTAKKYGYRFPLKVQKIKTYSGDTVSRKVMDINKDTLNKLLSAVDNYNSCFVHKDGALRDYAYQKQRTMKTIEKYIRRIDVLT